LSGLWRVQSSCRIPLRGHPRPGPVRELIRFGSRQKGSEELVTEVRDRERLRQAPRTLTGRRVAIGEEGGLDAAVGALRRLLVKNGAHVTTHHHPDGSVQASEANAGGAEVYLGLRLVAGERSCSSSYYAGVRYQSPGGRRLAELLQARLPSDLAIADGGSRGMSIPLLRETRMPAVICEIGPA